jgi:hypothetical protein
MLGGYIRIVYFFQCYLLVVLLIQQDILSALPTPNVANANNKLVNTKVTPTVSNNVWVKLTSNPGKDKLNARQLKDTRTNIVKTVVVIVGSVSILFIIGGIISIIVYYVKKKGIK